MRNCFIFVVFLYLHVLPVVIKKKVWRKLIPIPFPNYLQVVFFLNFVVDVPDYCKAHPDDVLPDPFNCGQYFNCSIEDTIMLRSRTPNSIGVFRMECTYPALFESSSRQCKHFENVQCENRPEPQAPCKYIICLVSLNFFNYFKNNNSSLYSKENWTNKIWRTQSSFSFLSNIYNIKNTSFCMFWHFLLIMYDTCYTKMNLLQWFHILLI